MPTYVYGTCPNCGATGDIWERGSSGYCLPCYRAGAHMPDYDGDPESFDDYGYDEFDTGEGIHQWDYRPELTFYGDGPYHLGFELEISASNYDVRPILQWCQRIGHAGMLYVKEDGSVNGFEIVSHPMTPEFFDSVPWDSFFQMLGEHYPRRTEPDGHGLHVHVSRSAFPHQSTLARWSYLLHRNRQHVERVARRSNSRWCGFIDYPVSACLPFDNHGRREGYFETDFSSLLECECCYERVWLEPDMGGRRRQTQTRVNPDARYVAVNLANRETVEVRVFRSTRDPQEFRQSIHLVAATVEFARSMQPWHATRQAVSWQAFADYVRSHPVFANDADAFTGENVVPVPPAQMPWEREATPAFIREWARRNGFYVESRGRIASDIRSSFRVYTQLAAEGNSAARQTFAFAD